MANSSLGLHGRWEKGLMQTAFYARKLLIKLERELSGTTLFRVFFGVIYFVLELLPSCTNLSHEGRSEINDEIFSQN